MKYKELYKKIKNTVAELETTQDEKKLIRNVLETIVTQYGELLHVTSGRLYVRDAGKYRLVKQIGNIQESGVLTELPMEFLPIRKLREDKYIIMHRYDRGFDEKLKNFMVVDTFAAIALGTNDQYLVSFSIQEPVDEEVLHYSLNTIRFVTNFKLRELSLHNEFLKARKIQLSLLPEYPVERKGFDIFGRSIPAALVGGDAYDYLSISDNTVGIAVMDAVGHGLPAALQARDVITGLRMGVAGNIKIEFLVARLNRIIYQSNLASRFVSLFYGELEDTGHFVYTNAGHPPAFVVSRNDICELRRGGMVLGPNPTAKYRRGFVYLHSGDILTIYTDGITEARNIHNEEYGVDRLKNLVSQNRNASAREIGDQVFSDVRKFSRKSIPTDDQTLVIIKREFSEAPQF